MEYILALVIFFALGTIALKAGKIVANLAYLGMVILVGIAVWTYVLPKFLSSDSASLPSPIDIIKTVGTPIPTASLDKLKEVFDVKKTVKKELLSLIETRVDEALKKLPENSQLVIPSLPAESDIDALSDDKQDSLAQQLVEFFSAVPSQSIEEPVPTEVQSGNAVVEDTTGEETIAILTAQFDDELSIRQAQGVATMYRLPDGDHFVRLEDFALTNGPDLHVYLSVSPVGDVDRGFTNLGPLKAAAGDHNYAVETHATVGKFKTIVIYSTSLLFPYAIAPFEVIGG